MNEEINVVTNETIEYVTNEIIEVDTDGNVYKVAKNINTMLSVLTFTIIIIFLFKYLKVSFPFRR